MYPGEYASQSSHIQAGTLGEFVRDYLIVRGVLVFPSDL